MRAVERYRILDTPADGAFDRIAGLAARLFSVPVAIVSVVDHDRIWFKAHHGTEVTEIGRDPGLCASAILQDEVWVIEDAARTPEPSPTRWSRANSACSSMPACRCAPRTATTSGTFCILDRKPRDFTDEDTRVLEDLAAIVMNDLEMRLQSREALTCPRRRCPTRAPAGSARRPTRRPACSASSSSNRALGSSRVSPNSSRSCAAR